MIANVISDKIMLTNLLLKERFHSVWSSGPYFDQRCLIIFEIKISWQICWKVCIIKQQWSNGGQNTKWKTNFIPGIMNLTYTMYLYGIALVTWQIPPFELWTKLINIITVGQTECSSSTNTQIKLRKNATSPSRWAK